MLYNTDLTLWENQRKHLCETMTCGGAIHTVHDGHIGNGMYILARFESTRAAEACLKKAGWRKIGPHQFKAR